MTAGELLATLRQKGIDMKPEGDRLRYRCPQGVMTPNLLAELARHKGELLASLREASEQRSVVILLDGSPTVRHLRGHTVRKVIWETEKAIVFEDDRGNYWRYLHHFKTAWPVVIETLKEKDGCKP